MMTLSVERVSSCRRRVAAATLASLLSIVSACNRDLSPSDPPFESSLDLQLRESLEGWGAVLPIIAVPKQSPALVELGRALFFDKVLSGNRDVSCGTCHDPAEHAGDGMSLPVGTGGVGAGSARLPGHGRRFVPRNAPSLLNQGLTFPYVFWDGRLVDGPFNGPGVSVDVAFPSGLTSLLARQAILPILNRAEMRGDRGDRDRFGNVNELAEFPDSASAEIWAAAMRRVMAVGDYVAKLNAAYPGTPITSFGSQHVANAIAAFELEVFTKTGSPFDRFLERDTRAMSDEAKRGGILFFGNARCAQCHSGPLLGGQQFANIGIPQFGPGVGEAAPLDIGRAEVVSQFTGFLSSPPATSPPDPIPPGPSGYDFAFRVPQLRNVELTAPYMHNGAYPTLEVVVRHYTNPDSALRGFDVAQIDPSLRAMYHGDPATTGRIIRSMDFRLRQPVPLTPAEQRQLVAFLESLTDPSARNLSAIVPPSVPSGLPVRD